MSSPDIHEPGESCLACPSRFSQLRKLGLRIEDSDFVVALAGNPNTGKTTVFNALTGLRMHTGNWPGKTISRAEGAFLYEKHEYSHIVDHSVSSLATRRLDYEFVRMSRSLCRGPRHSLRQVDWMEQIGWHRFLPR